MRGTLLSAISPFFEPVLLISAIVLIYNVAAFLAVLLAMYDILLKENRPPWHLLSPLSHSMAMVFYVVVLLMIANIVIVFFVAGSLSSAKVG